MNDKKQARSEPVKAKDHINLFFDKKNQTSAMDKKLYNIPEARQNQKQTINIQCRKCQRQFTISKDLLTYNENTTQHEYECNNCIMSRGR